MRYGWHGFDVLSALIEEKHKEDYWKEYIACHLWYATSALYAARGAELKTPFYAEIVHPNTDQRTAEQIKADIVRKFST